MNGEMRKTLLFAGAAALLVILAAATAPRTRSAVKASEVFADQGQPFYADFTDPLKATAIEVIDYDEATAAARFFKVQLVDGKWSIPSHHNYPADGKDRLAKTAAAVIDLKKDRLQSESPKDHVALSVVDPLDASASAAQGRGKRVRLYGASGSILADYIFGKAMGEGRLCVRLPDQKRTYAIKASPEISTKFEDWVETDLLQISAGQIRKIVIDKYSFDEAQMSIKDRLTQTLARGESLGPWTLTGIKSDEEINDATLTELTNTLDDLRLAGVRPKPRLVAQAKDLSELGKLPRNELVALARELSVRGFFIVKDQDRFFVVSNEGEMEAACEDGVVYTLRFGEVLVGAGDEVSAGKEEPKEPGKEPKKEEKKGGTENRYLFVSVRFDETLLGAPPAEPKPYVADPAKKPEDQQADEAKAKHEKEEYDRKKKEFDQKKDEGQKRAEKLTRRFAEWYYVISDDAFKKLRVDRAKLVKPKEEKKPEEKKP